MSEVRMNFFDEIPPGMRTFKDLEDVRANLDTLTFDEMDWCNQKLHIVFSVKDGKIAGANYEKDVEMPEYVRF